MGQPESNGSRREAEVRNVASHVTGPVVQVGSVTGDVVINTHGTAPSAAPDQLPRRPGRFVNRVREFEALDAVLDGPEPVGVAVVSGLAGVGKSALVTSWAADRAERFPDGRLYVDFTALRTPDGTAVADGLAECLRSLGVAEEHIPATLAGRTSLYRTRMSGSRRLVVLDDVAEPAHVTPFLVPARGSVVVATSNERLVELTLDGGAELRLQPLNPGDSVRLLGQLCRDGRIEADPAATERLARACAGLPVALRVVAGRMLSRPYLTASALADELADDSRRLRGLALRGEHVVSAVFDNSYRDLDPESAGLYRRLGLLPLHEIPREVVDLVGAAGLDRLLRANLVDEVSPDRFAFHGLVGLHARERAAAEEPAAVADELLRRVLEHYAERLRHADRAVMGDRLRIAVRAPVGASPFGDRAAALEWLVAERANLLALLRAAVTHRHDDVACEVAEGLTALYLNRRLLADWVESAHLGVESARRTGNPAAEARLRSVVSRAYTDLAEDARAGEELELARALAARGGDRKLVASVWEFTGRHLDRTDPVAAIDAYRTARAVNVEADEPRGAALATYFMGRSLHAVGRHDEALETLLAAHAQLSGLGDQRMAARVLIALGALRRDTGALAEARRDLEQAVAWFRETRATHYEEQALVVLADVVERGGDVEAARAHLRRAVALRVASGGDAAELRARLDG
ncbi:tetratricopeptide repeat protein [Actinosynnema sp. CA-248983]